MSRTKRMPSVIVEQSQVEYINHVIELHNRWPTKTTKIRKSRSQYERECEEADEKYYQALHALSEEKSIDGMMYRLTGKHNIYRRWVARYNYERVIVSVEDVIEKAKLLLADPNWPNDEQLENLSEKLLSTEDFN